MLAPSLQEVITVSLGLATSAAWIQASPAGDDASLIEQAQRGDPDAFRALHDRYAPKVRGYLTVRVADPSSVDDLLQDTFAAAWLALPRYESRGIPFAAWLRRIAHNKAMDYYRGRKPADSLDVVDASGLADTSNVEEHVLRTQRREELLSALDCLPEAQRRVIVLRFFEELTSMEVGQRTNAHPVTVRGQQFRALRSLRRALSSEAFR